MNRLNILSRTEVGSSLYQPRRNIRVASEILKMNPTLRYFLSLTLRLASNQLHTSSSNWCQGSHSKLTGTLIEFLSKLSLALITSVTWGSKFSAVFLQQVEYPSFGRCSLNYRWLQFSFSRLACVAFKFFIQLSFILVPRGRAPFGQHQESRPLARSNTGSPRFTDFPSLCGWSESSLKNLIGSGLNLLCSQSHSNPECRCTWPEVAFLGADQKERALWGREWTRMSLDLARGPDFLRMTKWTPRDEVEQVTKTADWLTIFKRTRAHNVDRWLTAGIGSASRKIKSAK